MKRRTRDIRQAKVIEDDIEFFFAMFVDMHGKPCAKLVPASAMDVLMEGAGRSPGFAAGPMWQTPADPDMIAVPDASSYIKVPWREGLAVVMCDIAVDGELWPYTPRVILRRQARPDGRGGPVPEGGRRGRVLPGAPQGGRGIELADPLDTADFPVTTPRASIGCTHHLSTVSLCMNQLGFTNYANDHEDANGQFEQNFVFDDALVTADRLVSSGTWCGPAGSRGGHGGHVHAQAVRPSHRERVAQQHLGLGGRQATLRAGGVRSALGRAVALRLPVHRWFRSTTPPPSWP